MMSRSVLEEFEKFLTHYGYLSILHDSKDPTAIPTLVITIPKDQKDRERFIQVRIEEAALTTPLDLKGKVNSESLVQFHSILPFTVPQDNMWEVLRILNFINKTLATPCFVLEDRLGKIICRYSFLKPERQMSSETFISLLSMVHLWLDAFSESIEEVANGKSMTEVIENRIKDLTNPSQ